jgi:hypothetical protein
MSDHYSDTESKGMPRWVKVTGIVVVLLVLLVIGMLLLMRSMGGGFGPDMHG